MRTLFLALALTHLTSFVLAAPLETAATERATFRALYEQLVEIDSSPSTGSCTKVVAAAQAHLQAAGFTGADLHLVIPPGKPDDGNLVARIRAAGAKGKGVLLLAHIDVVDARRADWERDPFTLIEENGYFYARGSADDKAMAAVFLDLMLRLKREANFRPSRDVIMALTCGEETSNRINGVDYLLQHRPELIDAAFAINEGAGGLLSEAGEPLVLQLQAGEKIHQVYTLTATNPGGHSSRPVPQNAIYQLASATQKIAQLAFPIELTPVVREYFRITGPLIGGDMGEAMAAVARNPDDRTALEVLEKDPTYNALLRTTCVGTQLDGGHAANALPQRATLTLSCRVMQGTSPEQVLQSLQTAVDDAAVQIAIVKRRDGSQPPPLSEEILGPVRTVASKLWPGVPLAPSMTAGATDGRFLMNAGIPTYGMSGMFSRSGDTNAHGLNEKILVKSLYEGREFLDGVVRAYVK